MVSDVDADAVTEKPWFVYLLVCRGGRLYAGVTPDLVARMRKHRSGTGAKFTRAYPPETLLAARRFESRGMALSMEHQVKRLSATAKRELAATWLNEAACDDDPQLLEALACQQTGGV